LSEIDDDDDDDDSTFSDSRSCTEINDAESHRSHDVNLLQEIDTYLDRATEQGYSAFLSLGGRVLSFVTTAVLTSAAKGQSTLAEHLSRSTALNHDDDDDDDTGETDEVAADALDGGPEVPRRRRRGRGRSSESTDADESANEILRAAYRREVSEAGDVMS